MLSVQLVSHYTVAERVAAINNSNSFSIDEAKNFLRKSFETTDDDIIATSSSFSTTCPLSLCKIKVPSRGINCSHLQCFDLETFLVFNKRKNPNRWICPVCNKVLYIVVFNRVF